MIIRSFYLKNSKYRGLLLFVFVVFIYGCSDESTIQMVDINNEWKIKDSKKIEFEVDDYTIPRDIIFIIRNNDDYPYSNLFLIASMFGERDTVRVDTLNYILAKPNGEWLGRGFGSTKEIHVRYKTDFIFPKNGKYTLEIKQGMRKKVLKGIEDIGVKIDMLK